MLFLPASGSYSFLCLRVISPEGPPRLQERPLPTCHSVCPVALLCSSSWYRSPPDRSPSCDMLSWVCRHTNPCSRLVCCPGPRLEGRRPELALRPIESSPRRTVSGTQLVPSRRLGNNTEMTAWGRWPILKGGREQVGLGGPEEPVDHSGGRTEQDELGWFPLASNAKDRLDSGSVGPGGDLHT